MAHSKYLLLDASANLSDISQVLHPSDNLSFGRLSQVGEKLLGNGFRTIILVPGSPRKPPLVGTLGGTRNISPKCGASETVQMEDY